MSIQEYMDYDRKNVCQQLLVSEITGNVRAPQQDRPLLPNLKMGETFDKVFGTDVISIVPQGSAELIFGYNMSRIDNPALVGKKPEKSFFSF